MSVQPERAQRLLALAGWRRCPRCRVCLCLVIASFELATCDNAPAVSTVTIEGGVTPFISFVHLAGLDPSTVIAVQYTIATKAGGVSKPVHVTYSSSALAARGYTSDGALTVPIFGMYAGQENHVSIQVARQAGAPISLEVVIPAPVYADPSGIYSNPHIMTPRVAASTLGFDFIFIKSGLGWPVVIDTDAEIRWAAPSTASSISSAFSGDAFFIGDPLQPTVYRLSLDGHLTQEQLTSSTVKDFHHNIDPGKHGLLAEVDTSSDYESTIIELDTSSLSIDHQWDLAAIVSAYMSGQGDDAGAFVRPGTDWFHSNSAIYDPRDDSLIVSSRENFVIKLDYTTGAIIWILGDPTKYWYSFPSLRAKALMLAPGGLYPIGQHGLSITPDGLLMLFNNGLGSFNQPSGAPAGQSRSYSTVSAYSIDLGSMSAQEVWHYDAGQTIDSAVCSSAYASADDSILVDYAVADDSTEALLVGLDPQRNVVFEFQYPTSGCGTSWNAQPISLDDLRIDQ